MAKAKKILVGLCALLLVVIALQNTEAVDTRLLFYTVRMPRVLLLLVTLVFGFAAGVLVSTRRTRIKERESA